MEMTQTRRLPVPQEQAWQALNDTATLQRCIPGCESIEADGEHGYQVALVAAVGPVKARFKGRMVLTDIQAPDSYTIQFDGQGGAAGFGKGTARVTLTPADDETELQYTVNAQVGGKIAQIGSRLVDAAARKLADAFFTRFTAELAGDGAPGDATSAGAEAAGGEPESAGEADKADKADKADDMEPAGDQPADKTKRKASWTAWISKS